MPLMRVFAGLAASVALVGALAWSPSPGSSAREWGAAYAQQPLPRSGVLVPRGRAKAPPKAVAKKPPKLPPAKPADAGPPPRSTFSAEDEAAAAIPGIADARVWGDSETEFEQVLPQVSGPWLALSGGGADGAYGAGVITGWTETGNRPEFALVSGVSIGALIAPYAFVGPKYDEQLKDNFTTINAGDVFEDHATPASLLDSWPLARLIEKRVTADLLTAIAAEHKRGRRLLVVTTNVDTGRRVVWNMGAIAAKGGDASLKLFRDVLLASSSIPGFFPPVTIDVEANGKKFEEMHNDGTLTAPFFVAPESMFTGTGEHLPKELYVIANSKLTTEFSVTERRLTAILGRSIGIGLVAALRAELLLTVGSAQRLGINLSVSHVSDSFSHPAHGLFDPDYMKALFKVGQERAKAGNAFENIKPSLHDLRTGPPQ